MIRIRGVSGPIVGHYRLAALSGLTTGLGANAIIFAARWATTALLRAAIQRLKVTAQIVTPFTAANELSIAAYLASSFTASDTGGGSNLAPPAGQNSFLQVVEAAQASNFTDIRIASATALAAGTRTLDTTAFLAALGAQDLAAASAAQNVIIADYDAATSDQRLPIILQGGGPIAHGGNTNVATNAQGIEVQSPIAQGAGGTVRFLVEMEWVEYGSDSAEGIG
jgi:hypothetical protein